MSTFWSWWVSLFAVTFLIIMFVVVWDYWKKRKSLSYDTTVDKQDGIEDRDGPIPLIFFIGYWILFVVAIVFFLLYPGLGGWKGLLNTEYVYEGPVEFVKFIDEKVNSMKGPNGVVTLETLGQDEQVVRAGQSIYDTHCIQCHRSGGQGQLYFPNLTDSHWIYGGSDKDIIHSIQHGRQGAMPGFKAVLTTEQIDNVIWYVLSRNPDRRLATTRESVELGQEVYAQNCASCHGQNGEGNQAIGALNLVDNSWLYGGSHDQIRDNIKTGIYGVMPEWGSRLSDGEIYAVAAYVKHENTRVQEHLASLNPDLVERGYYLARMGDCMACHTDEGGENFGGGLGFKTPFGSMYSKNISPNPDEGIGSWTYEEFSDALRKGKGKTWSGYLYPAMPFTSYRYVTDEDTPAIWEYMQSVTPVSQKNHKLEMMFPANIRLGMLGWDILFSQGNIGNYLFGGGSELEYPEGQTESWKRGKYLVMGLGHCMSCHTPRNLAMAMELNHPFQGAIIDGWDAPNITATELYKTGWTAEEMTEFFKHGHSGKGSAFGGMAEAIKNSLRYLTDEDLSAISEYLITGDEHNVKDTTVEVLHPTGFSNDAYASENYRVFSVTCGACHGLNGKGREGIAPTLLNNGIIMHDNPYDTIAVVVRGLEPDYQTLDTNFMPMADFDEAYSDAELAELITFVRKYLGGRNDTVKTSRVTKIRKKLEKEGFSGSIHESYSDVPVGTYNTGSQ